MYRDRTLQRLAIIALILTLSAIFAAHATAEETTVYVDAPDFVSSSTFDAEIKIENVYELNTGEFHLLFDPNVVNVTDVTAGSIENMSIMFTSVRCDKIQGIGIIKVLFDISGTGGASGSGSLATVAFEVTGTDGNCSILNISNTEYVYLFYEGELGNVSAGEITAEWENDIVCIGGPSSSEDGPEAKVTIFVENRDDDDLTVYLYIDGDYEKCKEIKDESHVEYCDGRRLTEGVHTFEIRWHDYDTDKDYVKTEERSVSGTTAVTLRTDEHTEDDDKISAHVYVKNLDDDDLDVYLYIDEAYKKYKSVSSGSVGDYGEYEFEKDEDALHSFRIEWSDSGTGEDYEKVTRSYITGEEAVTLYIDKHTAMDMISLHEEVSNPVSIPYTQSTAPKRTVEESGPTPTTPPPVEDYTEDGGMKQHISATCTLVAFVAVLFVLMQIRRM